MGWTGGVCSGTAPCAVTMSTTRSVTATFDPLPAGVGLSRSAASRTNWDYYWYYDAAHHVYQSLADTVLVSNTGAGTLSGLTGTFSFFDPCESQQSLTWVDARLESTTTPTGSYRVLGNGQTLASVAWGGISRFAAEFSINTATPGVIPVTIALTLNFERSRFTTVKTLAATSVAQTTATLNEITTAISIRRGLLLGPTRRRLRRTGGTATSNCHPPMCSVCARLDHGRWRFAAQQKVLLPALGGGGYIRVYRLPNTKRSCFHSRHRSDLGALRASVQLQGHSAEGPQPWEDGAPAPARLQRLVRQQILASYAKRIDESLR